MREPNLTTLAVAASQIADIESAAIFVLPVGSSELALAGAAGIDGPPLERLVVAVCDPTHPIARTAVDGTASFDVAPTAPGGPVLRSHLPLIIENEGSPLVLGVLAVAHEHPLDEQSQHRLDELAGTAADLIVRNRADK